VFPVGDRDHFVDALDHLQVSEVGDFGGAIFLGRPCGRSDHRSEGRYPN
jgi:hypothetical protein